MDNDEREPRDTPPDEPDQPRPADADDEFETASWPARDIAEPEPASPPPADVEAYGGEPLDADAAATAAMAAHSVPATEPGESTQCPRCGTLNRPGIAFCSNCGQRLVAAGAPTTVARPTAPDGTQACPRCGTHNRAGTAFCQNCGANLQATPESPASDRAVAATPAESERAFLGPIVLLVGAVGLGVGWLLPFALGTGSLYDRAFGAPGGYGAAFWSAYEGIAGLVQQAYFGFAAPAPLLVLLLVLLAAGGMVRARPGAVQLAGLLIALVWAIGLIVLFVAVEIVDGGGTDLLGVLRLLSPAGIIFALASLIVMIGCFTRIGRA
jgi:DNA-directed RNA polymerase subunit RPC12/RpoP